MSPSFGEIVNDHFLYMALQPCLKVLPSYLHKWLNDPRVLAISSCTYSPFLHHPQILMAECHADERLRIGLRREWILQSKFVIAGDADDLVGREIKWFKAFLSSGTEATDSAHSLVRTVDFPYWSSTTSVRGSQMELLRALPSVQCVKIGILPECLKEFFDEYKGPRTANEYIRFSRLREFAECELTKLILVRGDFTHNVSESFNAKINFLLCEIAHAMKKEFVAKGKGAVRVFMDTNVAEEHLRDEHELEEILAGDDMSEPTGDCILSCGSYFEI
jgi:hypothetical protein